MIEAERAGHRKQIEILRRMTPEQRLLKAFELGDMTRQLLKDGIRSRFPNASEEEVQRIFLARMKQCYDRDW